MCMETHAAVSSYAPDGKLTVYYSTQAPYYMQGLLAGVLGLKEGNIRVISHYVAEVSAASSSSTAQSSAQRRALHEALQTGQDCLHPGRGLHRDEASHSYVLLRPNRRQEGRDSSAHGRPKCLRRRRVHRHGCNGPLPHRFLPFLPIPMEGLPL